MEENNEMQLFSLIFVLIKVMVTKYLLVLNLI